MTERKIAPISLIIVATIGLIATMLTVAALNSSSTVPLNGSITAINVELYTDASCTTRCTSLNFGTLSPGSSTTQTIYVKNNGTIPMTLSMTTSGWNPTTASSYLTLSWNRAGYILAAGSSVQATLTLTAASNTGTLTTFSGNVTITGTQ